MTRFTLMLVFVALIALTVVSAAFGQWMDPGGCLWQRDPFTGTWHCG